MNPSLLNKRISLLDQSTVQNSYGETDGSWNEGTLVWANVRTLTGRALFQANQVHSEITSKVIIRYRHGILPKMRIQYGNRVLEIISVINMNEESRFLELSCKEVV